MPEPAIYDPTLGDPGVARARFDVTGRHLDAVESYLQALEPGERAFHLALIADPGPGGAPWLEEDAAAHGSALAATLVALRRWWHTTRFEGADGDLRPTGFRNGVFAARALATIPDDLRPESFSTVSLAIEIDLSFPAAARRERFERATAIAADDVFAWYLHLRSSPFEVAVKDLDRLAGSAGRGSPLHALRLVPHIERWRSLDDQARAGYSSQPDVVAAVSDASAAYLDGAPTTALGVFAHGVFAFTTYRVGQTSATRRHLEKLGRRWTFWPWGVLRRPSEAVDEIHRNHGGRASALRRFAGS